MLGGAIGNLFDGVRFGYVIDFVHWRFYDDFNWPVFSLADAAISIGMGFLLIFYLREHFRIRVGNDWHRKPQCCKKRRAEMRKSLQNKGARSFFWAAA